jgi:hypothetical protein
LNANRNLGPNYSAKKWKKNFRGVLPVKIVISGLFGFSSFEKSNFATLLWVLIIFFTTIFVSHYNFNAPFCPLRRTQCSKWPNSCRFVLLEGVLLEGVLLEGVLLEGVLLEGVLLDEYHSTCKSINKVNQPPNGLKSGHGVRKCRIL